MEITYKGFVAKLNFSAETDSFFGEVLNSEDILVFHCSDFTEALAALQQTVDHYLSQLSPSISS